MYSLFCLVPLGNTCRFIFRRLESIVCYTLITGKIHVCSILRRKRLEFCFWILCEIVVRGWQIHLIALIIWRVITCSNSRISSLIRSASEACEAKVAAKEDGKNEEDDSNRDENLGCFSKIIMSEKFACYFTLLLAARCF